MTVLPLTRTRAYCPPVPVLKEMPSPPLMAKVLLVLSISLTAMVMFAPV